MAVNNVELINLIKELITNSDKMAKFKEIISDFRELVIDIKDLIKNIKG